MRVIHISAPGGVTRCGIKIDSNVRTLNQFEAFASSRIICEDCRQEANRVFLLHRKEVEEHLKGKGN